MKFRSKIFIKNVEKKKKRKKELYQRCREKEERDIFRSLNLSTSFYRICVNKKYEFNIRNGVD